MPFTMLYLPLKKRKEVEETKHLIDFYKEAGFIYSWEQLGIEEAKESAFAKIADYAASDKESFKLAVPGVQPKQIVEALYLVEELGK